MQIPSHTSVGTSEFEGRTNRILRIVTRLYVPIVTLIIIALIGSWAEPWANFDPLTVAQNGRLKFQSGDEVLAAKETNRLSPAEARLAADVVREGLNRTGVGPRILFMGDSQTMAIMDRQPGDLTTPQWVQVILAREEADGHTPLLVLGSLPNLSMPEFLVRLIAANDSPNERVNAVILCVTLRQWRGLVVRPSELKLAQQARVEADIRRLIATNPDLADGDAAIVGALRAARAEGSVGSGGVRTRFADRAEYALDAWFNSHLPLFGIRSQLRARIGLLFTSWRNQIFHITTASPRPVPANTYRASLQIVELALRYARTRHITMVLYLSPVRPIQPNPDIPEDLARFRTDVTRLCESYNAVYLDYTNLVPEKLWTNYPLSDPTTFGEPDFAHFTGPGHKLAAQRIMSDAGEKIGSAMR